MLKNFYDKYNKYENDYQAFFENYYLKQIDTLYRDIKYMNGIKLFLFFLSF